MLMKQLAVLNLSEGNLCWVDYLVTKLVCVMVRKHKLGQEKLILVCVDPYTCITVKYYIHNQLSVTENIFCR